MEANLSKRSAGEAPQAGPSPIRHPSSRAGLALPDADGELRGGEAS